MKKTYNVLINSATISQRDIYYTELTQEAKNLIQRFGKKPAAGKYEPLENRVKVKTLQQLVKWYNAEVGVCYDEFRFYVVMGSVPAPHVLTIGGSVSPIPNMVMILHIHPAIESHKIHFKNDILVNKKEKSPYPEAVIDLSGNVIVYGNGELVNETAATSPTMLITVRHQHSRYPTFLSANNPSDPALDLDDARLHKNIKRAARVKKIGLPAVIAEETAAKAAKAAAALALEAAVS